MEEKTGVLIARNEVRAISRVSLVLRAASFAGLKRLAIARAVFARISR